jgi:hypothetical protein
MERLRLVARVGKTYGSSLVPAEWKSILVIAAAKRETSKKK